VFSRNLTEDAELRLLEPRHAEEVFALVEANRKHLDPWLPWVEETKTSEDTQVFIRRTLHQFAEGNGITVGIWYKGKMAGVVGMDIVQHRAELGYWLAEQYEGKGLISATCQAIIDHAFKNLGLLRIQIRMEPANTRSRAVARRLGFSYEGTLRKVAWLHEQAIDLEVHSLLLQEWKKQAK